MAAHPDVDTCLRLTRPISQRLSEDMASLPAEAWDQPSSCTDWRIRQLVAHVVGNADFVRTNVERGVAGTVEPAATPEERARRNQELAAMGASEVVAVLDRDSANLEAVFERLSADELERVCYHPAGNRPASWYARQRLAEVAFHYWDLERSLGRDAALDDEVGAFLLPMLVESNMPRVYLRGPRGQGRYRIQVEGQPDQSWLLTATPEGLQVARGADGAADVTVTAPAGLLALLIYGRANLQDEERRGRARVEGDRALADQFNTIFRGP
jgi:uncharacterized protein (TIGR03083 family)